jgi:hypothetical protein
MSHRYCEVRVRCAVRACKWSLSKKCGRLLFEAGNFHAFVFIERGGVIAEGDNVVVCFWCATVVARFVIPVDSVSGVCLLQFCTKGLVVLVRAISANVELAGAY